MNIFKRLFKKKEIVLSTQQLNGWIPVVPKLEETLVSEPILAWHFTEGMKLKDGQHLIEGKTYGHTGKLEMCQSGYHASRNILDALRYMNTTQVSRVECFGRVEEDASKLVCSKRKVLWTIDITEVLTQFFEAIFPDILKTVKQVYTEPNWNAWADKWLDGTDRTKESAYAATNAIVYAAADAAPAAANAAWAAWWSAAADAPADAAWAATADKYQELNTLLEKMVIEAHEAKVKEIK